MKRLVPVIATVMLLAAGSVATSAETPWETLEWGRMGALQRFEWALDVYRMNRSDDAAAMLGRVIAASPAPRVVVAMQDKLDATLRARMLEDEKTVKVVQAWAKVYESAIHTLRRDEAYIKEMVGKLAGDGTEMDLAMTRLEQLSEYAAPHVIRLLADAEKPSVRVVCRKMLLRLGRAAVLPTLECLHAPNDALRVTLLDVLGELRDVRAQAMVCQIAVDREETDVMRQAAVKTLKHILHQPMPGIPLSRKATVNYWRLADACLHEVECTLPTMEGAELPLWTWDVERKWVVYRMVPRALYNEELAEEACYDGLAVDKDDRPLKAMAIAVYFAQKLELIDVRADDAKRKLDTAVLVGGKQALQECLFKALADGDAGIAVQAAQALGRVGAGKGFAVLEQLRNANPLLEALESEDRAVRFAAARAIVRCQPVAVPPRAPLGGRPERSMLGSGRFDNHDKVVPALTWGLMYELPARSVLIIHEDVGTVNYYKDQMKTLGHGVVDATDVVGGMSQAAGLPKPDVVLLSEKYGAAASGLQVMFGSRRIPVVVLVASAPAEGAEAPDFMLVGQASAANVKLVLSRALTVPEKDLVTKLIPKISARAAQALATIVPETSPMAVRSAAPALRRVLASRDDAVLAPSLTTLGNVAAEETTLDVLAVAADARAAKPVRLAALDALAKILQAQRTVPPDVFAGLVPVSADSDAQVAAAAARAIAVAKFDAAQFADLLVLKRVQEIQAGRP